VGRVGDDHVGVGNRRHHPPLRHFALGLTDALLDLRPAFLILVLVAHFLLGHQQFLVAFPQLHRHVHRSDDDQPAGQPQRTPAHQRHAVNDRLLKRFMGDPQEVIDVGRQHHQGHEQRNDELGQRLDQFDHGLHREHAFKARSGVHPAEFRRHGAGSEQPAAEGDRPDQCGQQQSNHDRLDRNQGDLARNQQEGAHGFLVHDHFPRKVEIEAHQVHQFLRQHAAKDQQTTGAGKHHRQGVELF